MTEHYKIIRTLGEGSFGKCYLVEAASDHSKCVIKQVDLTNLSKQEQTESFKEAKILEQLDHPNIIRFREVYKTKKNKLCIVMDFADGGDLGSKIKGQNGKLLTEGYIMGLFVQICLALKHVHDRKIIHRDLKAQNIFLMQNGNVKLGDFGIAKVLAYTMANAQTMVGTPYYLSPEIVQNRPYNFQSDIWSLGVLLYEMCTLRPPFDASNIHSLAMKIVDGRYAPLPAHFSSELRHLMASMLIREPNSRPTIHQLLRVPIVRKRIEDNLSRTISMEEFSHTILHGVNILEEPRAQQQAAAKRQEARPADKPKTTSAVPDPRAQQNQRTPASRSAAEAQPVRQAEYPRQEGRGSRPDSRQPADYRQPIDSRSPPSGNYRPADYRQPPVDYRQPADYRQQPPVDYRQPADYRQQPSADYRPPADYRQQPSADYRPPADYRQQPSADYRAQPQASDYREYRSPAADYRQQEADYRPQPAANYRPPPENREGRLQVPEYKGAGRSEQPANRSPTSALKQVESRPISSPSNPQPVARPSRNPPVSFFVPFNAEEEPVRPQSVEADRYIARIQASSNRDEERKAMLGILRQRKQELQSKKQQRRLNGNQGNQQDECEAYIYELQQALLEQEGDEEQVELATPQTPADTDGREDELAEEQQDPRRAVSGIGRAEELRMQLERELGVDIFYNAYGIITNLEESRRLTSVSEYYFHLKHIMTKTEQETYVPLIRELIRLENR